MKIFSSVFIIIFFSISISASSLRIDSVTVDSVWNSDSSWYDGNGVLQQRTARDCLLSFIPQDSGFASCSLTVSLDSGKTWGANPNPLQFLDSFLSSQFQCGKKGHLKIRVLGNNRSNVAFKITANICYYGGPNIAILGNWRYSIQLTPTSSYNIVMTYDSLYNYAINLNVNGTDTLHKEFGHWHIVSDTIAKTDTIWMDRVSCFDKDTTTNTIKSVDCGNPKGRIKLDIQTSPKTTWRIPLEYFVNLFPTGLIPTGIGLPNGLFVKD